MKETPIFEEVFTRLMRQPGFWVKFLIGSLLSFVPVVNVFAFGYLFRLSKAVREMGQPFMPDWDDWAGLFRDGVQFAVVWLGYWLLPVLIASLLSLFLKWLGLGALAYTVLALVCLLASVLLSSALYRFHMRSDFKDLLDVVLIVRMTWMELPRLIIPALVLLGLLALLLPLYGFALFGGFLLVISYSTLCFRRIEKAKSV